ncbi:hypothetical protein lacNasYZ03_04830 [Lactobacillus nasalidis]|uniref:DNA-directed RNA polymerase beta subunit n=1 Tax=Lactobacillus nasalidis TaxID=2797258 RepID=A0ABQ3W347_9LACO|nr:hypothetical protein lacNasYZ01_05750 [Lactobacillus nasalidis]GHV99824.1 hypothetical protein lacNasYZ02_12540 [Lactobacillus nasalidis]GHW00796.1 hypothetical protein lacNasYZ03_04830 [Lactobacillus nasalidis]
MTDFFARYQDRGMKKWAGFFLSDHTAMINKETQEKIVPERSEMSQEECARVLALAFSNQQAVIVQLGEVDENGKRPEEIVGFVRGYTEDKVVIDEHVIALDSLRCVLLLPGSAD